MGLDIGLLEKGEVASLRIAHNYVDMATQLGVLRDAAEVNPDAVVEVDVLERG